MQVHQFVASLSEGDAVSQHAIELQKILRRRFDSEIYYDTAHPRMLSRGIHFSKFRPRRRFSQSKITLIYHLSIGSPTADFLLNRSEPCAVYYHNITPARFFVPFDTPYAELLDRGREQLKAFSSRAFLGLANSEYSRQELAEAGYPRTDVMPLLIDFHRYDATPDAKTLSWIRSTKGAGPDLLFVGRIVPNKRPDDLVKLLYVLRRYYGQDARLFLVGWHHPHSSAYSRALESFARSEGIEGVQFTGAVNFQTLLAYYQGCDLFVSMSEHEGFGVPLIEAMHLGLPVVAYSAAAVPETTNGGAVVLSEKDLALFAEAILRVHNDSEFRDQLVASGRKRSSEFMVEKIAPRFLDLFADPPA